MHSGYRTILLDACWPYCYVICWSIGHLAPDTPEVNDGSTSQCLPIISLYPCLSSAPNKIQNLVQYNDASCHLQNLVSGLRLASKGSRTCHFKESQEERPGKLLVSPSTRAVEENILAKEMLREASCCSVEVKLVLKNRSCSVLGLR